MSKSGIILVALSVLVAARPPSASASDENILTSEPAKITVRVYNYAGISAATLGGAQREAGRAFAASGVEIIWVECLADSPKPGVQATCRKPLSPENMIVRILKQTTGRTAFNRKTVGFATGDAVASVIYDRVRQLLCEEDLLARDLPLVLGGAIAHEVGHLLLGSDSHSPAGIMRERWLREDMLRLVVGQLRFTDAQSTALRAEVRRRISPAILTAEGSGSEQSPNPRAAEPPQNTPGSRASLELGLP